MAGIDRYLPCRRAAGAATLMLAPLLASGCLAVPEPSVVGEQAGEQAYAGVEQQAASQIKRCYRTPRIASSGKQITTRLRVRYRPDGGLAELPMVVAQSGVTPVNRAYAGKMAEAAGLAVMRCAPVKLPPELYSKGWSILDFTFSPGARA
jgi:hypothetical protein